MTSSTLFAAALENDLDVAAFACFATFVSAS